MYIASLSRSLLLLMLLMMLFWLHLVLTHCKNITSSNSMIRTMLLLLRLGVKCRFHVYGPATMTMIYARRLHVKYCGRVLSILSKLFVLCTPRRFLLLIHSELHFDIQIWEPVSHGGIILYIVMLCAKSFLYVAWSNNCIVSINQHYFNLSFSA